MKKDISPKICMMKNKKGRVKKRKFFHTPSISSNSDQLPDCINLSHVHNCR